MRLPTHSLRNGSLLDLVQSVVGLSLLGCDLVASEEPARENLRAATVTEPTVQDDPTQFDRLREPAPEMHVDTIALRRPDVGTRFVVPEPSDLMTAVGRSQPMVTFGPDASGG